MAVATGLMAALTARAVVVGVVMAPAGAVDVAAGNKEETTLDLVARESREVDAVVADNGKPAPETMEEDGRRMTTRSTIRQARRIKSPSALPGRRADPSRRRGPSRRTAKTQPLKWTSSSINPGTTKPVGHGNGRVSTWTKEQLCQQPELCNSYDSIR
ncbi:hypothetical protein RvY_16358 [Ramazzottius varieornatus]|uniref:Secreted protein n=1 Tax=Ramazzottius varieornatus TaxID=947166 RepID=A0A1D1W5T0_RAMVA|nr:hypothetical protein RvY_16358 [Ramazzottius varieornatus]